MSQVIQAKQVVDGFRMAASFLQKKQEILNHMNVFPVADQDTGTNMLHSMRMVVEHLPETGSPAGLFSAAYRNLLQYSHGNSGTILTLFFEGFSEALSHHNDLTGRDLALAFSNGADRAYHGVSQPMDGTLLSVAKQSAAAGISLLDYTNDAGAIWERMTLEAFAALPFTALRNPVLKRYHVMDSGAYGFCIIIDAFLSIFCPELSPRQYPEEQLPTEYTASQSELLFRYCTEFILECDSPAEIHNLRPELAHLGDSFLLVHNGTTVKVHIHTNDPEMILALAKDHGNLLSRKVEDMAAQLHSAKEEASERILVCCQEEEQKELFTSLGAIVLATKNGFCPEVSSPDTYLQKPFSLYSSLSPEQLNILFSGTALDFNSITYRDDDLSLAELLLN